MIGKGKLETRIATMPEVLEILEERRKAGEIGYEQEVTQEYSKKFSQLSVSEAKKLVTQVTALGISEKTASKIAELMPTEQIQVKHVLVLERKVFEDETVNKIVEIVKSYK